MFARLIRHTLAVAIVACAVAGLAFARSNPVVSQAVDVASLQTGDLVFQASESAQAPAIKEAQRGHPATHVGIVVRSGKSVTVLEAIGPVVHTPWSKFTARTSRMVVMRDPRLTDAQRASLVTFAERDLGKPYDLAFASDDAFIYCSELVWRAYQQLDVALGTVEKTGDLALDGPLMQKLFTQRWQKHPRCQGLTKEACRTVVEDEPIMTPASLLRDDRLVHVAGGL